MWAWFEIIASSSYPNNKKTDSRSTQFLLVVDEKIRRAGKFLACNKWSIIRAKSCLNGARCFSLLFKHLAASSGGSFSQPASQAASRTRSSAGCSEEGSSKERGRQDWIAAGCFRGHENLQARIKLLCFVRRSSQVCPEKPQNGIVLPWQWDTYGNLCEQVCVCVCVELNLFVGVVFPFRWPISVHLAERVFVILQKRLQTGRCIESLKASRI